MLYITRKKDQKLIINHEIEISIVEIKGNQVKLGINCSNKHSVLRGEIVERIIKENQSASQIDINDLSNFTVKKP